MVIGAATPFGPILAVSNVLLASLWLWFTINGYLAGAATAVRRAPAPHGPQRDPGAVDHHQPHLDSDAVHRLQPLQDSVFGGNEEHFLWVVAGVGRVAGLDDPDWSPCSRWLTRKPAMAPSSISQQSDMQPV